MAGNNTKWPNTELALTLGEVNTFGALRREHLIGAAVALGLAQRTAIRELDAMLANLPWEADLLIAAIAQRQGETLAHCPDPDSACKHFAACA